MESKTLCHPSFSLKRRVDNYGCEYEKKQASMTKKCHNQRPQINLWHSEEEIQNTGSYSAIKVKQPTFYSRAKQERPPRTI